jgi:flagellar biosynthesis protein FliP
MQWAISIGVSSITLGLSLFYSFYIHRKALKEICRISEKAVSDIRAQAESMLEEIAKTKAI